MQLIDNHEFLVPSRPEESRNLDYAFTAPITSREQRRVYKAEFDRHYSEYQQLHGEMIVARNRFTELQDQLRSLKCFEERKSREIQMQIAREYSEASNSMSFQQKRQRFEFLHAKLGTIKRLVSDFDALIRSQRRRSLRENNS